MAERRVVSIGEVRSCAADPEAGAGEQRHHGFALSDDFSTDKMGVQWSFYAGDAARPAALSL